MSQEEEFYIESAQCGREFTVDEDECWRALCDECDTDECLYLREG